MTKTRTPLILASASPRRLDLLKTIDIVPDQIIPADIDEAEKKREKPQALAGRLACEKALKVAAENPDHFVLAADTVVAVGRRILPKTETIDEARTCLEHLSGRRHSVFTGHALVRLDGKCITRTIETAVKFKRLSTTEIEWYLDSGEWQGVAGGYAVQGKAAALIGFLSGSHSNVIGLCLYTTRGMLLGNGYIN